MSLMPSARKLLTFSISTIGICTSLCTPTSAEDARVLPGGRSRMTFVYAQATGITETFDNNGDIQSLTKDYNFELSSSKLKDFDARLSKLVNFLNATGKRYEKKERENGFYGITQNASAPLLGDALSLGKLNVGVEAQRQEAVVSLQHGVTDQLTVALVVPTLRTQVKVAHSISGNNTANDIYYGFVSSNPSVLPELRDALDLVRNISDDTFQGVLTDKGYARVEDWQGTGLGDIYLLSRYNWLKLGADFNVPTQPPTFLASFQTTTTAPTGKTKNPAILTETDFGQGSWDMGVAHIVNVTPWDWITLSQGIKWTQPLFGHRMLRVRKSSDVVIPDLSDEENVTQKLGTKESLTLGASLNFTSSFSISGDYEWGWKQRDRYEGSKSDRDYTYLSEKTDIYTETLIVGASFSTIPFFLKNDFPLPLQMGLTINLPYLGRNTTLAPYGIAELSMVF
ncbi:hypothetical protein WDW86_03415 [Bdellovibrionota bacterium FG-2]